MRVAAVVVTCVTINLARRRLSRRSRNLLCIREAASSFSKQRGNRSANGVGAIASRMPASIQSIQTDEFPTVASVSNLVDRNETGVHHEGSEGPTNRTCTVRPRQQNHRSKCLELPVEIQLFRLNLFLNYKLAILVNWLRFAGRRASFFDLVRPFWSCSCWDISDPVAYILQYRRLLQELVLLSC